MACSDGGTVNFLRGIKKDMPDETALQKNRERLPMIEPVANLTGNEFGADIVSVSKEEVLKRVGNVFSQKKIVHNKELGDIQLSNRGIRENNAHGNTPLKRMAYGAVLDVLERGVVIDISRKHKNHNYDTAAIAAPVKINEETHIVGVIVKRAEIETEKNACQRFYLHKVYAEDKASTLFKSVTDIINNAFHRASVDAYNE
jgi:hypothetical protein